MHYFGHMMEFMELSHKVFDFGGLLGISKIIHGKQNKTYRSNAHPLDIPNALINITYHINIILINKIIYNFDHL